MILIVRLILHVLSTPACDDLLDDDGDGLVDCDDPDCEGRQPVLRALAMTTFDNDNDGLIDCLDEDC